MSGAVRAENTGVGVEAAGYGRQPEIQGMRALSVLAVVWAHAQLPGLPGGFTGVDVFFVISGFLITRLLLREETSSGRIDLIAFWARRARRLLPNAYAALIGTLLLALFVFPGYNPIRMGDDIASAVLQIANFRFAAKAVDYFESESPQSPVLHFWSLSIEEQYYIVWPVLLVGICFWAARDRNRWITLALGLIWGASFIWCVAATFTEQSAAYFSTGARLWQLATGALLAAGWQNIGRLPRHFRVILAWGGLASILLGLVLIDESALYPGFWALLPTLGAAALLAGFDAAKPTGALRSGLNASLMQWIGERSYSWYLWHWPLLAMPRSVYPDAPFIEIIALPISLLVACFAYSYIEKPFRHGGKHASVPAGAFVVAIGAAGLIIVAGQAYLPTLHFLDAEAAARAAKLETASRDTFKRDEKEICSLASADRAPCIYGDVTGQHRVVLVGDSHAEQWFPAFDAGAKLAGWQLSAWTKGSCPAADVTPFRDKRAFTACNEWREDVLNRLTGPDAPDIVVLANYANRRNASVYDVKSGGPFGHAESIEAWRAGFRKTLERLLAAGTRVAVIRDVPRPMKDYRSCFMTKSTCITPRSKAFTDSAMDAEVVAEFSGRVALIDFTDGFCDATGCPLAKDGMFIYLDSHHMTATFAATFAPRVADFLRRFPETPENVIASE